MLYMLTRGQALQLIREHVHREDKIRHMIAVAAMMKGLARKLGANEKEWELVGLLHDLDYGLVGGDMKRHGLLSAEMLEGKLSEECLHAIRAHDYRTGVRPQSRLEKALVASDCIWCLMVPLALDTAQGKIGRIKLQMLEKAYKRESVPDFLKKDILMCQDIGLPLTDFLRTVLAATPPDMVVDASDL
jgi:putative nucleotidyltransferase with HDIG domain